MKLPRRREDRIIFIKAGLPEEERESLIVAPSHLDAEERGLQHSWHGPSWKTRGMFRVLTFEPKWKYGAFLGGIRGKSMAILIGAEGEMRRTSTLQA
jgi:hypothetical protein